MYQVLVLVFLISNKKMRHISIFIFPTYYNILLMRIELVNQWLAFYFLCVWMNFRGQHIIIAEWSANLLFLWFNEWDVHYIRPSTFRIICEECTATPPTLEVIFMKSLYKHEEEHQKGSDWLCWCTRPQFIIA